MTEQEMIKVLADSGEYGPYLYTSEPEKGDPRYAFRDETFTKARLKATVTKLLAK